MNNIIENAPLDFLTGNIKKDVKKITGSIKAQNLKIDGNISSLKKTTGTITYGIGMGGGNISEYKGEYNVIPTAFEEQILYTKNKKMTDNVTIKEIPYSETSNLSGGLTVYIAGRVEIE